MRKRPRGLVLAVLVLSLGVYAGEQTPFPKLRGPYLGQKPPGLTPEPFAPGIVTTAADEGGCGFAREGTVCVFQKFLEGRCQTFITRLADGVWTAPELIPFWKTLVHNGDFTFSSDDRTMLYQIRTDPGSGPPSQIWKAEVTETGWSQGTPLPPPINTEFFESFASDATDGTLYFFSRRPGGKGRFDLYASALKAGGYVDPVDLEVLNTEYDEWDPFIAPDGRYLLFCSTKPGGLGRDDIYIAFRGPDGRWGEPVNLGPEINSPGSENRPCVSRDGKYLFFTSTRNGDRDVFWVRAEVLDRSRK